MGFVTASEVVIAVHLSLVTIVAFVTAHRVIAVITDIALPNTPLRDVTATQSTLAKDVSSRSVQIIALRKEMAFAITIPVYVTAKTIMIPTFRIYHGVSGKTMIAPQFQFGQPGGLVKDCSGRSLFKLYL